MEDDRQVRATVTIVIAVTALACLGGCGGGDEPGDGASGKSAAAVIRDWADTLRSGDVRRAAEFFALPSLVENGTSPSVLYTRADARLFNESLPCGARLLRTSSSAGFTTAVFRLTERPGRGTCGAGTGQTARTTFVVRDGKIREWRRVANNPAPSGPVV
jgi:hypothetical protein